MEERRSFVDWLKCPIVFSKEFNYVRFQKDRPSEIHKYVGFSRWCGRRDLSDEKYILLNFAQVYSDNNGGIRISEYAKEYWPGWYNTAEHLKEEQVKKILKSNK